VAALVVSACSTSVAGEVGFDEREVPSSSVAATGPTTVPVATSTTVAGGSTTSTSTTSTSSTSTSSTSTSSTPTTTTTEAPGAPGPTTTIPPELNPCPPDGNAMWDVRMPADFPVPDVPVGWRTEIVGESVRGREIIALVRPASAAPSVSVLVVGGLHANELTSTPVVRHMVTAGIPDRVELWLVPESNPDGTAVGTRCNANGVDLNRNFAWDWEASDGGPGPLSEPEAQVLADLVTGNPWDLVAWVHQPLDYIGPIGPTDPSAAEAWAAASGTPLRLGITQHGGSESWTAFVARRPSVLVEVGERDPTPELVAAHRAGLEAALVALTR
jgi:protein MpaA